MSLTIVEHDSRVEKLPQYFTEKFNPANETPQQYLTRLLRNPSPFNGFNKTPEHVKREIWKRTTALINRKYKATKTVEEMYTWETEKTGIHTVKTGNNAGLKYPIIKQRFIWISSDVPRWIDLATGNPTVFNKVRFQAHEIAPIAERGQWYSLDSHRFVSWDVVKKASSEEIMS
jgi:hypothetical protein